MSDHDEPKKFPNPAFLKTRTLGSRNLADIDYDDEGPTGVNHTSERPPRAASAQANTDPNDIYFLTDRPPAKAKLPSFQDTAPGPGSLETPRNDLPPVAPLPRARPASAVSAVAHSPFPPVPGHPSQPWPPIATRTATAQTSQPTPGVAASAPIPLVARTSSRPKPKKVRRKGPWKAVVPPPRFPKSEPLFRVVSPRPEAIIPSPKPVEDRLLNALGILLLGLLVTALAGFAFLTVTDTRTQALSSFITKPLLPPSLGSAAPAESAP